MLVIGEAKDGYIITATSDEIANLQGMYSCYSDGFKVKVGDNLNISGLYKMCREASRGKAKGGLRIWQRRTSDITG